MQALAALAAVITAVITFVGGVFSPTKASQEEIVINMEEKIVETENTDTKPWENRQKICYEEYCFQIEKAVTEGERARGLMFRESLPLDQGMLFVFEEAGKYGFRMKNTLVPLDIIWLDKKLRVLDVREADPCTEDPCPSYGPESPADYVLEINQGLGKQYGIEVGTKLIAQ